MPSYLQQVLAHTPDILYELAEPSGTTVTDSSGNGRGGAYTGTPTLGNPGVVDGFTAMTPAAAGDAASSTSTFNYNNKTTTCELWVKAPSAIAGLPATLAGLYTPASGNNVFSMWIDNTGKAACWCAQGGGQQVTSVSNVADGNWHHIAATMGSSGGTLNLYVDGNQEATLSAFAGVLNFAINFAVAGAVSAQTQTPVGFTLAFAAIYSVQLSSVQIDTHFQALRRQPMGVNMPQLIYMRKKEGGRRVTV